MNVLEEVSVGDKLLVRGQWDESIVDVDRLTKTQVVCGNSKYRISNGSLVGGGGFYGQYAKRATEEDIKKVTDVNKTRVLLRKLLNGKTYEGVPLRTLEEIYLMTQEKHEAKP